MTDSNDDDTSGRPPRERASRPRTGGDRPPKRSSGPGKGGSRPPGKGGGNRPFQARGGDDRPARSARPRPAGPRRDDDRPSRDGERTGWRPEGQRQGSQLFRDPDAGEAPRFSRNEGGRSFRSDDRPSRSRNEGGRSFRGDERPRGPRPSADQPARGRAEARTRSAPRDDIRQTEARAPKVLPAEARLQAEEPAEDRIAKVIARAGVASRRDAEAMIAEGRVTLNGEVLTSPAVNVTKADTILVDGEPLPAKERTRLWLYHKERGLVTTARDPEGRPTVFDSLPEDLPRVVAVGRLDINTEGLLLLTNDGGLAKVIAHPDTGWLRRYRVRAHGEVTQADLDRLRDGVTIDGMEYGPVEARLDRVQGDNVWITLGLREGKNREVKRILEHLGLSVNRLIRLSFGPFQLGDLEPGLVEEVRTRVLKDQLGEALAAEAGVDFESPVREPIAPFGTKPAPDAEPARAPRRRDDERPSRGRDRDDRPARGAGAGTERARPDPLAPRRSVWRSAGDTDEPRPARKAPRRGTDPREARAQSAERDRERVGSITTGEGRKVKVERLVSAPAEAPEEKPRRAPRSAPGAEDRPRRAGTGRPERSPRPDGERPSRTRAPAGAASDRPPRSRKPDAGASDRPYRARKPEGAGSQRPYRSRDDRPARGGGEDRPYRSRDGQGARGSGEDRPYRSRGDQGARGGGEDRPYRSRDGQGARGGGEDRPRRGPPRGDAPGRGAPGRGGSKGGFKGGDRGGSKGGFKGGAKGGGRGGPGGPRGRRP